MLGFDTVYKQVLPSVRVQSFAEDRQKKRDPYEKGGMFGTYQVNENRFYVNPKLMSTVNSKYATY